MSEHLPGLEGKLVDIPEFRILDVRRILLHFGAYLLEEPQLDCLNVHVPFEQRFINAFLGLTPKANWKGQLANIKEGKNYSLKIYCELGEGRDGSHSEHLKIYRGINFPQLHLGWSGEAQGVFQDSRVVATQYQHGLIGFLNFPEIEGKWIRKGLRNEINPKYTKINHSNT